MTAAKSPELLNAVTTKPEWNAARVRLLEREKALTLERDRLAEERRALPWVRIKENYVFTSPEGQVSLSEQFGPHSQLIVKHFMLGPGQSSICVGCSLEVEHAEGLILHLTQCGAAYAVVARAPIEEIEAVRERLGWKILWVSSFGSSFNYDFQVSFRPEELRSGSAIYNYRELQMEMEDLSGDSVFYKNEAGKIFHTYSTFARGGEGMLGIYRFLDMLPKGRGENGPHHALTDWARPRALYGLPGTVERSGRYHDGSCPCSPGGRSPVAGVAE